MDYAAGGGGAPAPPRPPGGPIKGRAKAASGAGRGGEPDSCYVNDPGMVNVDAWINGKHVVVVVVVCKRPVKLQKETAGH